MRWGEELERGGGKGGWVRSTVVAWERGRGGVCEGLVGAGVEGESGLMWFGEVGIWERWTGGEKVRQAFCWDWDSVSVARPAGGELSLGMHSMCESGDAGCLEGVEALERWDGGRPGELVSATEKVISGIENSLAALMLRS